MTASRWRTRAAAAAISVTFAGGGCGESSRPTTATRVGAPVSAPRSGAGRLGAVPELVPEEVFIRGLPDRPLQIGEVIELEAAVWVTDDGTSWTVEIPYPEWSSSEPAVASVDQRGHLLAHAQGRTRVSVTHLQLRAEEAVRVVPVTAYDLTGQVVNHNHKPVADVVIVALDGPAAGEVTGTRWDGRYVLHGLTGDTTVAARKDGFTEVHQVARDRSAVLDFALVGLGPRSSFGGRLADPDHSFQWIVGDEIVPGRYFGVPEEPCYWQRRSEYFGSVATGTYGAAPLRPPSVPQAPSVPQPPPAAPPPPEDPGYIGARFWSRPGGQEIVDIHKSDLLFLAKTRCGKWGTEPVPSEPTAAIGPGTWLVGSQITPGTYRAERTGRAGYSVCRWERLRSFGGASEETLEQSEWPAVGRQTVIIRESDVGFTSDGCGPWSRVPTEANP